VINDAAAFDPDTLAAAVRTLADGQPHSFDEIIAGVVGGLKDSDHDRLENEVDRVLCLERFHCTGEEDFVDLVALLDGRVFTHRPVTSEIDSAAVTLRPDLVALAWPFEDSVPLAGGGQAVVDIPDGPQQDDAPPLALAGPAGWLDGADEGDLLAFVLTDGELRWRQAVADEDASRQVAEGLSHCLENCLVDDLGSAHLVEVIAECIIANPAAFAVAVDPLEDLLAAANLQRRGDWLGRAGTEWIAPHEAALIERYERLKEMYGFDPCCHEAYALTLAAFQLYEGGDLNPPREIAKVVSHGNVANALAHELMRDSDDIEHAVARLILFAQSLRVRARGADAAVTHYLEGIAHDALGDLQRAETEMHAALAADADFGSAREEASWYCELRGNWAQAATHLLRAGADGDHPRVVALQENAAEIGSAATKTGRNEPCPCGAGKKYKACCMGRENAPLATQATWLYGKAVHYLGRPGARAIVLELAEVVAGSAGATSPEAVAVMAHDPLVTDVALFEEEIFDEFLEVAGPLLSSDERDMGEAWLKRPRALYEVVETRDVPSDDPDSAEDVTLVLRDTLTGDEYDVRWGGSRFAPGVLLIGRVGPVGDHWRCIGSFREAPLLWRPSLLQLTADEPNAIDWMLWLRAALAPPELRTREGEPILMCSARYRITSTKAALGALAQVFESDDSSPGRFHDSFEQDGDVVIRGWVRVEGKELTVTTNSAERFDDLRARVEAALPGATLIAEERLSPDALRAGEEGRGVPAGVLDPESVPPELRLAMDEMALRHAERWVDESVPALGGLTPRQARDDPTRREDLLALLREFEGYESAAGAAAAAMPVLRIREILGLSEK
jgi:tetratricopeptide (TPR) repeat protein